MSPLHLAVAAILLSASLPRIAAQEAIDPFSPEAWEAGKVRKPSKVGILVDWYQVDIRTANKLIRKHAGKISSGAMREELDALIDSGDAELFESAYIATRSGNRSRVESVDEITYLTEIEPIPEKIGDGEIPITLGHPIFHPFAHRNIGTTVEVDPFISHDGKWIDLNIFAEITEYLGDRHHADPLNPKAVVTLPAFYSISLNTSLKAEDGAVQFAGMLTPNPKKHPGKRLLVFIQANVLR